MAHISRRRSLAIAGALLLAHGRSRGAAPARTLVFAGAGDVIDSATGRWLALIYTEALQRLGYRFELRAYPTRRASTVSDAGTVDGEINRVADYGRSHPNMIRIDPSHFSIGFAAYAAAPVTLAPGWAGVRASGRRVEYRRGVARAEIELDSSGGATIHSSVNSTVTGLRKLEYGRSDIFIDLESVVDPLLGQHEFARTAIRKISLIETAEMHAFLHVKNRALAAPLSAVLASLKRAGFIEQCRLEAAM